MAEERQLPPPVHHPHDAAVVSACEESEDHDHEDDLEEDHLKYGDPEQSGNADQLYGAHLDDEDEAWVYQNLRSGVPEPVAIYNKQQQQMEQAKLLKPRNSDAVLSCPCCFTIVCMDCQRHERYSNQYRAMFVMNIGVDWNSKLLYDHRVKHLVDIPEAGEDEEVYHSVYCLSCQTQVAALDMKEEIYHFFDCLASS
jgi:hypothetical protein